MQVRSSWQVVRSVWYALFMREILGRLFGKYRQIAWVLLLLEPSFFIVAIAVLRYYFNLIGDSVGGVHAVPWMSLGLIAFFMFRDTVFRAMGAVNSNKTLFAYRQVKTVDAVLIRSFVELFIYTIILSVYFGVLALWGFDMMPSNIVIFLVCWILLWLFALGIGLCCSVLVIIEGVDKVVKASMIIWMIAAATFTPLQILPIPAEMLLYLQDFPLLNMIESLRLYYFEGYWTIDGMGIVKVVPWVVFFLMLGLALHFRFQRELKAS